MRALIFAIAAFFSAAVLVMPTTSNAMIDPATGRSMSDGGSSGGGAWGFSNRRRVVDFETNQRPGTIIIKTSEKRLYLVLEGGKAMRYAIGTGRPGTEWYGVQRVSAKREWPDWRPTARMRSENPRLPAVVPGGPNNPLGARALYLGNTLYRIHGMNAGRRVGTAASAGCIFMSNDDVVDLYNRTRIGAKVIVQRWSAPAPRNAGSKTRRRCRVWGLTGTHRGRSAWGCAPAFPFQSGHQERGSWQCRRGRAPWTARRPMGASGPAEGPVRCPSADRDHRRWPAAAKRPASRAQSGLSVAAQSLGLEFGEIGRPAFRMSVGKLGEIIPTVDAGIVQVVETEADGVVADRLDLQDLDRTLAARHLALAVAVSAYLGAGAVDAQIFRRERGDTSTGIVQFQRPPVGLETDFLRPFTARPVALRRSACT